MVHPHRGQRPFPSVAREWADHLRKHTCWSSFWCLQRCLSVGFHCLRHLTTFWSFYLKVRGRTCCKLRLAWNTSVFAQHHESYGSRGPGQWQQGSSRVHPCACQRYGGKSCWKRGQLERVGRQTCRHCLTRWNQKFLWSGWSWRAFERGEYWGTSARCTRCRRRWKSSRGRSQRRLCL